MTLQGDVYIGEFKQQVAALEGFTNEPAFGQDNADVSGGNVLLRWRRSLSEGADWEFQAYYDHTKRDELNLYQQVDTMDLEFQRRFPLTDSQEITWAELPVHIRPIEGTFAATLDPLEWEQDLYSAFIQDELHLSQSLHLSLGSKFEHNDFTGFEYQPSVSLIWQLAEHPSLRGAVSRAVRTPSRVERDMRINVAAFSSPFYDPDGSGHLDAGDYTLISVFGNKDFESEELLGYELGYRGQLEQNLSLDSAAFYYFFKNLLTSEAGEPYVEGDPSTNAVISTSFDNNMDGESYGLELAVNWQVRSDWRLHMSYTWLRLDMDLKSSSTDTTHVALAEKSSPEHQFQLHSFWNVRHDMEVDTALYYVASVEIGDAQVPAYTRLDVRFGWKPTENLELSFAGQNLFDDRHTEFYNRDSITSEVSRTLYAQLTLRY